ncbi:DUF2207 domain-containing protein [Nocardioides bizhenqiangii]|uniref:DUF2207 domain-containing protein n=1 Tax=Nocardioides bizhenqiangii TaxID=3095076 RepID=A0ABZ0ZYJ1_9ACTN|nr:MULTISPECIES: DUF2207 domain-containing protein [unclassified Nocardioides]MDZ5622165.1 DUF2207 domain-containing protein [Nocardioides sp. HM23]WQQ28656.1 DUF2207 domain-containing protein [Nocardioides sp. HM61]
MPRVGHVLASLMAVLLLSGCNDTDTPDGAGSDPSSTSPSGTPEQESSPDTVEDPVSVTLYDADFSVSVAGDLTVVETLTLDVPVDDRHGIFRTFDTGTEVEDFTATLDGGRTPVADSVEGDDRVFRIGDPDRTLSVGEHVVRMEYGVADVLESERGTLVRLFDWQLIPSEWDLDIEASDLTVRLPAAASQAECLVGEDESCDVGGVGTTTLVVTTAALADHTPVRVRVLLPPG